VSFESKSTENLKKAYATDEKAKIANNIYNLLLVIV